MARFCKFMLTFIYLCLFCQHSTQDSHLEQCKLTDVHMTNEEGSDQLFTVKQSGALPPSYVHCRPRDPNSRIESHTLSLTFESPSLSKDSKLISISTGGRYTGLIPKLTVIIGGVLTECDYYKDVIPLDLCTKSVMQGQPGSCRIQNEDSLNDERDKKYAQAIVEKKLIPFLSGDVKNDKKIAYGMVLQVLGFYDRAVNQFNIFLQSNPNSVAALYGRGLARIKKGFHEDVVSKALLDFNKVIELKRKQAEGYERRAEIKFLTGKHQESLEDIDMALQIQPSASLYFLRGINNYIVEDLLEAERDFRNCLEKGKTPLTVTALYNLGLTLYYRGKLRNSIEVFLDVLREDKSNVEAQVSLAWAYRELGDYKRARQTFNSTLLSNPDYEVSYQLRGVMEYYAGSTSAAVLDFEKCLSLNPQNKVCLYMQGLASTALGQFYEGIKAQTKVIIYTEQNVIKITPEYLKAHYLREYSRYLHHHLDKPLSQLNLEQDLSGEFRDHWAKLLPFQFKDHYQEQPGLLPHINDVQLTQFVHYPPAVQRLLCRARKVGDMMQVSVDGFLPNNRLNLAMGLAAIQIAQTMEGMWRDIKKNGKRYSWREMFDIGVWYRRLVDPEEPVLWLDMMPDEYLEQGYTAEMHFIRGHSINPRLMQYFELVFKLVKTMIHHYKGGDNSFQNLEDDLQNAETYDDIIKIAKNEKLNQHGFVLSTQVPSAKDKDNLRHDGVVLTLTGDGDGKLLFSVNLASTKTRSQSYEAELDYIFNEIYQEIKRTGVNKIVDVDYILNLMLSLVYYFYNFMPLSRGSNAVAYTAALGLIMSIGREITGKIPQGKLLDMEVRLSGAPDSFIVVARQWMNIKRISAPVSSYPPVSETFPTVRSVLEALSQVPLAC